MGKRTSLLDGEVPYSDAFHLSCRTVTQHAGRLYMIFLMLAFIAVAADIALLSLASRVIRRKMGPITHLGIEYRAAFAIWGCALLPILFAGAFVVIVFGTRAFGMIYFLAAEDTPKTPPPSEFVGVWEGSDKSWLLISEDGIASYRDRPAKFDWSARKRSSRPDASPEPGASCINGAWEIDGGGFISRVDKRIMSVTLFRGWGEFSAGIPCQLIPAWS